MKRKVEEQLVIDLTTDFAMIVLMIGVVLIVSFFNNQSLAIVVALLGGFAIQFIVFAIMNLSYGVKSYTLIKSTLTVLVASLLYTVYVYTSTPIFIVVGLFLSYSLLVLIVNLIVASRELKLID